jgi:hypothetical protein
MKPILTHHQVLTCLSSLPRRIISLHGIDNITEFVLHELSHSNCFDLEQAAYLVDNPDFDCLKGVAGVSSRERYNLEGTAWDSPETFSAHMQACDFNQRVRAIERPSIKRSAQNSQEQIDEIAHHLQVDNHAYHIWQLKNNNHGILIFNKSDCDENLDEHMHNAVHLLSFCPIF